VSSAEAGRAVSIPWQRKLSNRYVFFGLAAVAMMMFSIDTTIVAVAIPAIESGLRTNLGWVGWTITAYALTQTVMLPLAGKLSERFGRNRLFVACVALFTAGSLLCGLAPTIYLLILFRVVQAIGGGAMLPAATGILAAEFPDNRDRMLGLFSSIFPLGGIIGPNLGGLIVQYASWREVFLVNVPIGIVAFAGLLPRALRDEPTKGQRMDLAGAGLFAVAIVGLLMAMTFLGNDPGFWQTPGFWALLAVGGAFLAAFIVQERRTAQPMLDLALVGRNPFLAVNVYSFFFGAATFGFSAFIPYYAVAQFHLTAAESGAILTPRSIVVSLSTIGASLFLIRLGYRRPMLIGLSLIIAMLLLLSQGWGELSLGPLRLGAFWVLAAQVSLGGLGIGLAAPASNNAALDLLPGRAATISGLRGMFRSTGGVIGVALVVLGLSISSDKAFGMRVIFVVVAASLSLAIPLIFLIPDTARARHLERKRLRAQSE
jgi:EmrB/QacA subfamily drug resistance transporter